MGKKSLSILMAMMVFFTFGFAPVQAITTSESVSAATMKASQSLISMTEEREIEVTADLGYSADLSKLQWTFGGKPLDQWKQWDPSAKKYSGSPYITFSEPPAYIDGTTKIKAKLKFSLLYGTEDVSPRSLRTLYPALIGTYELAVKDPAKGQAANVPLKLNVYDEYLKWDEIKPAIDKISKEAINGRYVSYQTLGSSSEGRPMHFMVLAKDKASVDQYLNQIAQQKLENPAELKKKMANGQLKNYKVPIWINNIHPDESPGVDAIVELYRIFATEKSKSFKTADNQGREKETSINIDKALDNVIFLFNFTQNPDGRVYNTRQNANGFDLNRDNTYQTQIETQNLAKGLSKWLPVSLLDFHGFYDEFVIEPCTPPHNQNYEYDLLMDGMVEQAEQMGKAGIANTKYDSYLIPLKDWPNKFDDATPSYTSTFSMFHGAMGHTVEIPDLNAESYKALVNAGLGAAKYVSENKQELFRNQLDIYERGILGKDDRATDKWFVNPEGEEIGRDRKGNKSFFPDYYVIPVDKKLQKNVLEAHKMADYLIRNGIKVSQSSKTIKAGKQTYPKGSYVIDMKQAKRGFVNAVLYDGEDLSDWEEMYAEVVNSFHDLRGFTRMEVRSANAFAKGLQPVKKVTAPKTEVKEKADSYVVKNSSNEAVKAVNKLLRMKAPVQQLTAGGKGYAAGDYVISGKELGLVKDSYYLDLMSYDKKGKTKVLKQPKVFSTGSAASKYVLKELGFEIAKSENEADVVVDDAGLAAKALIQTGKPYIGIGSSSLNFAEKENLLPGFDYSTTTGSRASHEGLLWTDVSAGQMMTSGYAKKEKLYIATGSYIKAVPKDAAILAKVANQPNFFISGWWPKHEVLQGQTIAFTKGNITLFANDITNKAHPQYSYRLLANSIYAAMK
ncbi:X-prolyl-dipeptidyl aminopeptidase [Metabacillus sp. KIGAM252]|uniref:X-prolyl-dipeptidyl aminopeptidase n=1 Tax=Metabacillus flavus TaxID=2823519 RepID=A0ABS5LJF6_9BACI|nr:M14 family zinc carboxypeptidase [Metabacillus flavus]MBS2970608.1 X-prolyl-dipeptidyl aminopeptidase [Metabacillus flavus]